MDSAVRSKSIPCVKCGQPARLHLVRENTRIGLGGKSEKLERRVFFCKECCAFFTENRGLSYIYSDAVVKLAQAEVRRQEHTLESAQEAIYQQCGVRVPTTTLSDWGRKKTEGEPEEQARQIPLVALSSRRPVVDAAGQTVCVGDRVQLYRLTRTGREVPSIEAWVAYQPFVQRDGAWCVHGTVAYRLPSGRTEYAQLVIDGDVERWAEARVEKGD